MSSLLYGNTHHAFDSDRSPPIHVNLWKTALYNINSPWFTDGSYLKGENDKYDAGYAIETPFEVTEATLLP